MWTVAVGARLGHRVNIKGNILKVMTLRLSTLSPPLIGPYLRKLMRTRKHRKAIGPLSCVLPMALIGVLGIPPILLI